MDPELFARRLLRLRNELYDDGVRLPGNSDLADLVLAELEYARHPRSHEGIAPRYGALLPADSAISDEFGLTSLIDCLDVDIDVVRRLADGRSSFVLRSVGASPQLACLGHSIEYEASAAQIADELNVIVVQRLSTGWVRMCSPNGVATWDGLRWRNSPHSSTVAAAIQRQVPHIGSPVVEHLVDFCTHWLGAGRIGATLVWSLQCDPLQIEHVAFGAAVDIPPLDINRREHFSALHSALAQYDRAAMVDPSGSIRIVGVALRPSPQSVEAIPPFRGTRHTSAKRFSFSEPNTVTFTVSSGGSLSVFFRGEQLDLESDPTA